MWRFCDDPYGGDDAVFCRSCAMSSSAHVLALQPPGVAANLPPPTEKPVGSIMSLSMHMEADHSCLPFCYENEGHDTRPPLRLDYVNFVWQCPTV
jgi:hypothetical protein